MTKPAPRPTDIEEQIKRIELVLKAMQAIGPRRPIKAGWRLLKRKAS